MSQIVFLFPFSTFEPLILQLKLSSWCWIQSSWTWSNAWIWGGKSNTWTVRDIEYLCSKWLKWAWIVRILLAYKLEWSPWSGLYDIHTNTKEKTYHSMSLFLVEQNRLEIGLGVLGQVQMMDFTLHCPLDSYQKGVLITLNVTGRNEK